MTDDESPARWLPNAILFKDGITFEEWEVEWQKIDAVDKVINWGIGDALIFAERNFENWTQVVGPKYAEKHRGKMWLSGRIPPPERREGFSWSFHRELGSLEKAQRDRWFDRALAEGWDTVERLKEEQRLEASRWPRNGSPPAESAGPDLNEASIEDAMMQVQPFPQTATVSVPVPEVAAIRELIDEVRAYGREPQRGGGLVSFTSRILKALDRGNTLLPLSRVPDALVCRPMAWRWGIGEREDGDWEVRLRAEGQRIAIAIGPDLASTIVECALTARLSNLMEGK